MPAYRFVTVWRLRAPIDDVFGIIDDIDAWPEWWPNVLEVGRLQHPTADGLGGTARMTVLGMTPGWHRVGPGNRSQDRSRTAR